MVSNEESYGSKNLFKYFIEYNDNDDIRALCMALSQMIGYVKCFESNKTMSFKISDDKLLKRYTQIWKKINNFLTIKFDSEPVYGDNNKYIKTKIKISDENVNTYFHCKNIPSEKTSCKRLPLIILDSFVKVKKKCYPQTRLEVCKYEIIKTKIENLINDELEVS